MVKNDISKYGDEFITELMKKFENNDKMKFKSKDDFMRIINSKMKDVEENYLSENNSVPKPEYKDIFGIRMPINNLKLDLPSKLETIFEEGTEKKKMEEDGRRRKKKLKSKYSKRRKTKSRRRIKKSKSKSRRRKS